MGGRGQREGREMEFSIQEECRHRWIVALHCTSTSLPIFSIADCADLAQMLAAIGETLEKEGDDEVMGVVVNARKGFYRIGLWTKSCTNQEVLKAIGYPSPPASAIMVVDGVGNVSKKSSNFLKLRKSSSMPTLTRKEQVVRLVQRPRWWSRHLWFLVRLDFLVRFILCMTSIWSFNYSLFCRLSFLRCFFSFYHLWGFVFGWGISDILVSIFCEERCIRFFGGMVAWLDVYPANGVNEKGFIVKFIKHHFQIRPSYLSLKEVNCAE